MNSNLELQHEMRTSAALRSERDALQKRVEELETRLAAVSLSLHQATEEGGPTHDAFRLVELRAKLAEDLLVAVTKERDAFAAFRADFESRFRHLITTGGLSVPLTVEQAAAEFERVTKERDEARESMRGAIKAAGDSIEKLHAAEAREKRLRAFIESCLMENADDRYVTERGHFSDEFEREARAALADTATEGSKRQDCHGSGRLSAGFLCLNCGRSGQ